MDSNRQEHSQPHQQRGRQNKYHNDFTPSSCSDEEIVIKIVSALYGPCEGKRLLTGELSNEDSAKIPYTRDVTPILRALLQLQESKQSASHPINNDVADHPTSSRGVRVKTQDVMLHRRDGRPTGKADGEEEEEEEDPHMVRLKAISGGAGGMKRTSIPIQALHDGWNSMNIVFGDPCPGTSKKLHIHYVIFHTKRQQQHDNNDNGDPVVSPGNPTVTSEVHHMSFNEYDPVALRRQVTFYQDEEGLQRATARVLARRPTMAKTLMESPSLEEDSMGYHNNKRDYMTMQSGDTESDNNGNGGEIDEDEQTLLIARRMGRSQSISDFAKLTVEDSDNHGQCISADDSTTTKNIACKSTNSPTFPARRLRSATFEIVLPMILSFLQVRERVQCRLVCRLWRNIVRDWGVAAIIDSTDPAFQHAFTRPFLRGILTHSHSSLHSLRLSDFDELSPEDLHPSLPHLRKLRVLDISRCSQLNDETMQLLAKYGSSTLEVLYIKGLTKVTDAGISAICRSCRHLTVLDVSNNPAISDESGVLIGELSMLRALYMRDNFRLTNKSIDAITANCTKLNQLVLWGCVKLKHLTFDEAPLLSMPLNSFTSGKLVSLSLWGCYSLQDDVATAMGTMTQLRSLIVSECHRLTDQFAIGIAQKLPQLAHLYMRYCKRLTDAGINAIANAMVNLYSLDLSFCTKLTRSSICNLLESRRETLSELRLQECRQLEIVHDAEGYEMGRGRQGHISQGARDGQAILKSLKSPIGSYLRNTSAAQESNLSILDIRSCGGQPSTDSIYPHSDPFVRGMLSLNFEQRTPGFFARPARWNAIVQCHLLQQLDSQNQWKY